MGRVVALLLALAAGGVAGQQQPAELKEWKKLERYEACMANKECRDEMIKHTVLAELVELLRLLAATSTAHLGDDYAIQCLAL